MKLFEYEAKQVYAKYGISVPEGFLVSSAKEALAAAEKLKSPVAIKAQVLSGGRGRAGGIRFAQIPIEAQEIAANLLQLKITDVLVDRLLVERKLAVAKELFIAFTVDRKNKSYVLLASEKGGVDIEQQATSNPETVVKFSVNPLFGFCSFHAVSIAKALGYSGNQLIELSRIIQSLYRLLVEHDAVIVEVNPLAELKNGEFSALDAKVSIDDNSLFRQKKFQILNEKRIRVFSNQEQAALKLNLAYVKLDGNVGVLGNGAGLIMATIDIINYFGGRAADFLDVGGGASLEQIVAALKLVAFDAQAQVVFVNILGGITHCDVVAQAILEAVKTLGLKKPLIVRLVGTNEDKAKQMLSEAGIESFESMELAAEKAVAIAGSI